MTLDDAQVALYTLIPIVLIRMIHLTYRESSPLGLRVIGELADLHPPSSTTGIIENIPSRAQLRAYKAASFDYWFTNPLHHFALLKLNSKSRLRHFAFKYQNAFDYLTCLSCLCAIRFLVGPTDNFTPHTLAPEPSIVDNLLW